MPKAPSEKQIAEEAQRWWELSKAYHEGIIKYGFASVQSCFLINGGAIIALLTLIGSAGSEIHTYLNDETKLQIANIFFLYASGLVLAVLTHCLAYINFSALAVGAPSPSELKKYEIEGNIDGFSFNKSIIEGSRVLAIIFVLLSVAVFLYASWCASNILITIF